jgi:NarL family two-component system response regulator LiaR
MVRRIRVMLVDDHGLVHRTIGRHLEVIDDMVIVANANNGEQALALCSENEIDLILMDMIMPGMDGVEATRRILEKYPDLKILALSGFRDETGIREMLESGAVGYVLKDSSTESLGNTIRTAYEGKAVFSPEVTQILLNGSKEKRDYGLSPREIDVLKSMTEGLNNREIAAHLSISVSTVRFHISNILRKLDVKTRTEAVVVAARQNLI